MSSTKLVVCLLAIAGGTIGSFFLSLHNSSPKSSADLVARRLAAEQSAEKRRFLGGRSFSSDIRPLFTRGALAPEDMPLVFSASSERARRNLSLPPMLEANEGQFPADVDFVGLGRGLSVELNGDGIAVAATN